MINAQVKIIETDYYSNLEIKLNEFLKTIDVRQIIKTEYSSTMTDTQYHTRSKYSVIIYYVGFDDIREAKLDNLLRL